MPSTADSSQGLIRSTDNTAAAFLTFLADEQVSARTAWLYLGHLGRFAAWLREQYRAEVVEATSHDLREYRGRLAARQKPASVHAALAALQRFYGWARDTGRIKNNPTAKLKAVASQPLAPQGFTSVERQRLRREAERAGPMPDAIVTTLLNTGLRVDELIHLTWGDVTLLPRSGKAAIRKGKGDKARTVPLNTLVRDALNGVRPALLEGQSFAEDAGRTRTAASATYSLSLAVAPMCPTSIRIGSVTTRPGAWWSMLICRRSQRCWVTADWTPCGFTQPDMQALERAAATLERSDASSR